MCSDPGEFFGTLGVAPWLGRPISEEDDRAGVSAVAVLGYGYWERQFGSYLSIVGESMTLNGVPFTVVGVAVGLLWDFNRGQTPDMWLPLSAQLRVLPGDGETHSLAIRGGSGSLGASGRASARSKRERTWR